MIETMDRSTQTVLGFEVSGTVTKDDYEVLTPAVEAAIDANGSVSLLLDLTGFHWEKVSAWASDLRFAKQYHDKISKMAIVGDKKWERHLASLCSPYYAKEAKFFESDSDAWDWLEG